ncbi:hypothetical protein [Candidatus Hadarchaeum sp.]
MELAREKRIEAIVVTKLDRWRRSVKEPRDLHRRASASRRALHLHRG